MSITRWRGPQRWRGVQTWRGFLADLVGGTPESGRLDWTEPGTKTTAHAGAMRVEVRSVTPAGSLLTFAGPPQLVTAGKPSAPTAKAVDAAQPSARFTPSALPTVGSVAAQAVTLARSDASQPRVNATPPNEPRVGRA